MFYINFLQTFLTGFEFNIFLFFYFSKVTLLFFMVTCYCLHKGLYNLVCVSVLCHVLSLGIVTLAYRIL